MPERFAIIADTLREKGFIHLPAAAAQARFPWSDADWVAFADSWADLGPDHFMADGGRYRRRRFGAFEASYAGLRRKPHQPHYQSRDYNPLNGDVQRWFDPIPDPIAGSPILATLVAHLTPIFTRLDGRAPTTRWHSEIHQFRIETSPAELGRPTPEGLHRDGVDWVLVMLVARVNLAEGVTEIGDADGRTLGRFTLCEPGDMVVLDDRRIRHGVTPIRAASALSPAYRDALVVTWRAED